MSTNAALKINILASLFAMTKNWYYREVNRYPFHPVLLEVLTVHSPVNIRQLALEYPHASIMTEGNVAYTRDEAAGKADRQTVTTFNRYIRKHFPQLKDHEIRDYGTKCSHAKFEMRTTVQEIVDSARYGPRSCMNLSHLDVSEHPYQVYAPELGWAVAVRLTGENDQIDGRALVKLDDKIFVRSFRRGEDYSYSDEALEVWLKDQGFTHETEWPEGTKLELIKNNNDEIICPYIDGDNQYVDVYTDHLKIVSCGEYEATTTAGLLEEANRYCCVECGNMFPEDDVRYVDSADDYVCEDCLDNHYVYAHGRYGEDYYHENDVIYCESDGEHYVESRCRDFGIVQVMDTAEYYSEEDNEAIVYCHSDEEWYTRAFIDCNDDFALDHNGNLYFASDIITINNTNYYKDDLPEEYNEAINFND